MSTLSRRAILGSGVAGGLLTAAVAVAAEGTFGNPDQPAEGAVNVIVKIQATETMRRG
jgi:hypothetical protein